MLTWQQRIENYVKETDFPQALFQAADGRVVGMWIMGQNYKGGSARYGSYPAGYLKRIHALFPEKKRVLHLFSGNVAKGLWPTEHTVDIDAALEPDYTDDAQTLKRIPLPQYDLVLCDPPYSVEDADHYQTSMIKRNVVMRTLGARLRKNAHVVWLDQVLPMFRKDQFAIEAVIGMVKSTNHRVSVITIFRKK